MENHVKHPREFYDCFCDVKENIEANNMMLSELYASLLNEELLLKQLQKRQSKYIGLGETMQHDLNTTMEYIEDILKIISRQKLPQKRDIDEVINEDEVYGLTQEETTETEELIIDSDTDYEPDEEEIDTESD